MGDTRFPRIPVKVQKEVQGYIAEMFPSGSSKPSVIMDRIAATSEEGSKAPPKARREEDAMEASVSRHRSRSRSPRSDRRRSRSRSRDRGGGSYEEELKKYSEHRSKHHKKEKH